MICQNGNFAPDRLQLFILFLRVDVFWTFHIHLICQLKSKSMQLLDYQRNISFLDGNQIEKEILEERIPVFGWFTQDKLFESLNDLAMFRARTTRSSTCSTGFCKLTCRIVVWCWIGAARTSSFIRRNCLYIFKDQFYFVYILI